MTLTSNEQPTSTDGPGHDAKRYGPPTTGSILHGLSAANLKISYTTLPKPIPSLNSEEVRLNRACTDHMIRASWSVESGWTDPELVPYGPLTLMPTASVLHYATECFEGMKLYRGVDGKLRLLRPMLNCSRMLASAQRVCLPEFEPEALLKLILKLCITEAPKWLPNENAGGFLYIRPTTIADWPSVTAVMPLSAKLLIFMIVRPPGRLSLDSEAFSWPMKERGTRLLASEEDEVRAWPHGTGYAKIGANYGPALLPLGKALRQGFDQMLWLLGSECRVTETGSTNFFVLWRAATGSLQLVTAPLDDLTILAGVTRQTVLDLSRERFATETDTFLEQGSDEKVRVSAVEVLERDFSIFDIIDASDRGRLLSVFTVGTASFLSPVSQISFRGREINVEVNAVPHFFLLRRWLAEIMCGVETSPWMLEVAENGETGFKRDLNQRQSVRTRRD